MLRLPTGERHLVFTGHAVTDAPRGSLVPIGAAWPRLAPVPRYLFDVLLLVAAYYAAAHLGYALEFTGPVASIVWLPVGVGAATAKSMALNIVLVHIIGMTGTLVFWGANPRAPIGG